MYFNLRRPCKHCPFRTDIPPFLTRDRAIEIAMSLTDQDGTFQCHKTIDHDDETGDYIPTSEHEEHCAGALIILEKLNQPNQLMRVAERLLFYDHTKLDMQSPVFDNFDDWINAQ